MPIQKQQQQQQKGKQQQQQIKGPLPCHAKIFGNECNGKCYGV